MPFAMTDGFWLSLPGIISALVAAHVAVRQSAISRQIEVVHKATNSVVDKLVEKSQEAAHAAGVKQAEEAAKSAEVDRLKNIEDTIRQHDAWERERDQKKEGHKS